MDDKPRATVYGHTSGAVAVIGSGSLGLIASASRNGTLMLSSLSDGRQTRHLPVHACEPRYAPGRSDAEARRAKSKASPEW
jgi:hypothetical protein